MQVGIDAGGSTDAQNPDLPLVFSIDVSSGMEEKKEDEAVYYLRHINQH